MIEKRRNEFFAWVVQRSGGDSLTYDGSNFRLGEDTPSDDQVREMIAAWWEQGTMNQTGICQFAPPEGVESVLAHIREFLGRTALAAS